MDLKKLDPKKFSQYIILAFVLTFLSIPGEAASLDDIRDAAGSIRTISARFTQQKHMKILVNPLVSTGTILFKAPDALRFEYQTPVKNILVMNGNSAARYILKDNTLVRDNTSAMGSMAFVMEEIRQWMQGNFNTTTFNATIIEAPEPGRIVLIPKEKAMTRFIQQIVLVLSDRPGVFKEVIIREDENSFTRLLFEDVLLNTALDPAMFDPAK